MVCYSIMFVNFTVGRVINTSTKGQKNLIWLVAKKSQIKRLQKNVNFRQILIATIVQKTTVKDNFKYPATKFLPHQASCSNSMAPAATYWPL